MTAQQEMRASAGFCGQNREYSIVLDLHEYETCAIVWSHCGSQADVAELADAIDLGSITARCGGSSPLVGTGF